jgi:hypothetical protein
MPEQIIRTAVSRVMCWQYLKLYVGRQVTAVESRNRGVVYSNRCTDISRKPQWTTVCIARRFRELRRAGRESVHAVGAPGRENTKMRDRYAAALPSRLAPTPAARPPPPRWRLSGPVPYLFVISHRRHLVVASSPAEQRLDTAANLAAAQRHARRMRRPRPQSRGPLLRA